MAAKIPITATVIINSMSVKPRVLVLDFKMPSLNCAANSLRQTCVIGKSIEITYREKGTYYFAKFLKGRQVLSVLVIAH